MVWGHGWTAGCDVDHVPSPDSGRGDRYENYKINLCN